jgi:hypothetical protein
VTCSVKGNADDDEDDGEHRDSGESFHGYTRSIGRLAAPFGIARGVHGYAHKKERDDNH